MRTPSACLQSALQSVADVPTWYPTLRPMLPTGLPRGRRGQWGREEKHLSPRGPVRVRVSPLARARSGGGLVVIRRRVWDEPLEHGPLRWRRFLVICGRGGG